jgi:hypothetical protein
MPDLSGIFFIVTCCSKLLKMATEQNKEAQTKATAGCFAIVIVAVIFFYFQCNGDKPDDQPHKKKVYDKSDAIYQSHQFVKDQLKSPSTADFDYDKNAAAATINDSTFYVEGTVDSQNSFGGIVRANYSCTIIYHEHNGTANCTDLEIKQRR